MNITRLIISIVICQLAGILGALFTRTGTGSWYASIVKPSFNPPGWVFGPAWITLYTLMGISLYIIWNIGGNKAAIAIFAVQLFLNAIWTPLFFGLNMPWIAFAEIVVLWIAILVTIINFYPISHAAAYLLVPYVLWVTFASILNATIAILN